ncbi:hypothetical protein QBC39DRAFT_329637 [Podospora conica]|nr:hypothetical protein QBC39DRAFT_329637 [Schizothecium conicum]
MAANTTARLRRTFHYPADDNAPSDDDDIPSIMDEQEQESYIQTLTAQNATRNLTFTRLLLILPFLASLPHLLSLFRPSPAAPSPPRLLALLALTSLAATAYLLLTLPPTKTGITRLDNRVASAREPHRPVTDDGPLARYLPYLTPVLAGTVAVVGWMHGMPYPGSRHGWAALCGAAGNLPAVVHWAVVVAKVVMAEVEPGLGELEGLRYGYKGA